MTLLYAIRMCVKLFLLVGCGAEVRQRVARPIPQPNMALTRSPFSTFTSSSKVKCLSECILYNCSSFNVGDGLCELMDTYLCEGSEMLTTRVGFQYYDVEVDEMILVADTFRNEADCITYGECSPKCYLPTTTTTTLAPTTTTTLAPTTTTTLAPTTTTTTLAPTTTTTTLAPTTTTTTLAPTTTTTLAPTTTTTTTLAPTTTAATLEAPGPGEVTYTCSNDNDCTTLNADCRNNDICECVAGYSHDPSTKTCVTTCPNDYGETFSLTTQYYIYNYDITMYYVSDIETCFSHCVNQTGCVSIQFEIILMECHLSSVTKFVDLDNWYDDFFYDYYQRNCE